MKFAKGELVKRGIEPFSIDEEVRFPDDMHFALSGLRGLKDVRVRGEAQYFPQQDYLRVKFVVEGGMIVPCALTNVDVDYPFMDEREVLFSFAKLDEYDDNVIEVKKGVADLMPVVFETIVCEVPIKVVSEEARRSMKTEGKGWKLTSDLNEEDEEFDPRLAKLRELLNNIEK